MSLTKKTIVDSYGLHQNSSDGIWWLLQQSGGLNAIGLPSKQCPFRMKSNLILCPHSISLISSIDECRAELEQYEIYLDKFKILKFFDPVTKLKTRTIYIETDNVKDYHTISLLQQLYSPTINLSKPAGSVSKDDIDTVIKRLRSTNLSNYFIYNVDSSCSKVVSELATATSMTEGRLILSGPRLPLYSDEGVLERIVFDKELGDFVSKVGTSKLKAIGSMRLRKTMRV